jgi:hypothetical protein
MTRPSLHRHTDEAVRQLPLPTDEQAPLNARDDIKQSLLQTITDTPLTPAGRAWEPAAHSRTPARLVALAASAAAVAVLLVVAGPAALDRGSAPAYAVREFADGGIEVVVDDGFDGERLAATLRAYDIDVVLETEPVSPSLVGAVSGLGPLQDQEEGVFEWASPSRGHDGFLIDPARFRGSFYLLVSRQAAPGERYAEAADAFAPGEVLAGLPCVLDGPLDADRLARELEKVGQTPVWNILGHDSDGDEVPPGEVLHVNGIDAGSVQVTVRLDGDTTPHDASPYLAGGSSAPGMEGLCTDETTDTWR